MFNKQKADLEPSVLSGSGSANKKIYQRKQDGRGFGSERQRQRGFYTPQMYEIIEQCLLDRRSNLKSECGGMGYTNCTTFQFS